MLAVAWRGVDQDRHFAVDRGVALRDDLDTLKIAEVAECELRVEDDLWIVDVARLDRHVAAQELVLELAAIVDVRDRELATAILRSGLAVQYARGGVVGRLRAHVRQPDGGVVKDGG